MLKPILVAAGAVVVVGVFVLSNAFFTVHQTQQVLLLQFGEAKRVIKESGLNFKIPFVQNVVYIDKRILDLDSEAQEVIAAGQKRLVVDAFARYKIVDPLKFYQTVNSQQLADIRLSTLLNSAVRRVLGEADFTDIVRDKRPVLMRQITEQVNLESIKFGTRFIDVRIRRADLPEANSLAVFKRMQTERQREASAIRAKGREEAQRVRAKADRDVVVTLAEATREGEMTRGEGDGERNRIFAEAFGKDPEFFNFYRSMIAYQKGLKGDGTTMVLSPNSDFFRYFGDAEGRPAKPAN